MVEPHPLYASTAYASLRAARTDTNSPPTTT